MLTSGVILFHDNAHPHSAWITQELLKTFNWAIFEHPPYSSDLAPSNFALFPALKRILGGQHFQNDEEVKNFTTQYFSNLDGTFYHTAMQKLILRYDKCLNRLGDYVEK